MSNIEDNSKFVIKIKNDVYREVNSIHFNSNSFNLGSIVYLAKIKTPYVNDSDSDSDSDSEIEVEFVDTEDFKHHLVSYRVCGNFEILITTCEDNVERQKVLRTKRLCRTDDVKQKSPFDIICIDNEIYAYVHFDNYHFLTFTDEILTTGFSLLRKSCKLIFIAIEDTF